MSRFDSRTTPWARPSGVAKILDLGDEQDLIEQFVNADVLQRRNPLEDRVATPFLGNEVVLGHASDRFVDVGVLRSILLTATMIGTSAAFA